MVLYLYCKSLLSNGSEILEYTDFYSDSSNYIFIAI